MRDRLPQPLRRIGAAFGSFTPGQKAVTVLGVIVLVIGGYFFANWASQPSYAPLFSNLSGADASAIVDQLNSSGTKYQLADSGKTIMVPSDKVYDLRVQLSGKGLPAAQDAVGYGLLDKQPVTTSDFMQQIGYQRALEGELTKTIKSIDGVQEASVHLVIPKKNVFTDEAAKPTASVLVTTGAGRQVDRAQVQAIVHLVAASVEGLDPNQVTVASSDGTVLSAGDGELAGAAGGDRGQQTVQFEQRMNSALQQMLESVVGSGHARVVTTADLDFDNTETKTQKYIAEPSTPPLSETSSRETYSGGANQAGGVLGPDNIGVPIAGASASPGAYLSESNTRNNAVGMVTETRRAAPGNVRRLSVSVLLDANAAKGINPSQVQQMVSDAAGVTTGRGDTVSVTALPFDASAADQTAKTDKAAADAERQQQLMTLAKNGGLGLIVLILIFVAWRASRKQRRAALTETELEQLAEMQSAVEANRARAVEAGGADTAALAAGTAGKALAAAEPRANRQQEIAQMVEQQPDEVAQLLRGWLADRRS